MSNIVFKETDEKIHRKLAAQYISMQDVCHMNLQQWLCSHESPVAQCKGIQTSNLEVLHVSSTPVRGRTRKFFSEFACVTD